MGRGLQPHSLKKNLSPEFQLRENPSAQNLAATPETNASRKDGRSKPACSQRHQWEELHPAALACLLDSDLPMRPLPTDQLWWRQLRASPVFNGPVGLADLAVAGHPYAADLDPATEEEAREGTLQRAAIPESTVGAAGIAGAADPAETNTVVVSTDNTVAEVGTAVVAAAVVPDMDT